MLRVGIIGGTGYTGGELLRLLIMHPMAEITVVTSRGQKGKPVDSVHPSLKNLIDLNFEDVDPAAIAKKCDVVFTAVPHGAAMSVVPGLLEQGLRVIDLSADYRLPTAKFEEVYKKKHTDPREAVYGLPELHPEVKDANYRREPRLLPYRSQPRPRPAGRPGHRHTRDLRFQIGHLRRRPGADGDVALPEPGPERQALCHDHPPARGRRSSRSSTG